MIPEHYLHILLGAMPGAVIGFLASSLISAHRHRRLSAEEWMAARKYYLWAKDNDREA
jgi:hypothetical protein